MALLAGLSGPPAAAASPSADSPHPLAVARAVRVADHDGYTRFVIDFTQPITYSVDRLIRPFGLQIALPPLTWRPDSSPLRHPVGLLRDYRFVAEAKGGGEIILETTGPVAVKNSYVIPPNADAAYYRLVLDIEASTNRQGTPAGRIIAKAAATAPPQASAPAPQNFLGAPPLSGAQSVPAPAQTGKFNLTIEAPRRSPVPRASDDLAFLAKDIVVNGVTAYAQDDIRAFAAPLIGQKIRISDLVAVAEKIEEKYHQDGYILSQAYVPPQSVTDGIFRINVIEGYVAAVSVKGEDSSANRRVEALTATIPAARPLRISVIETALVTANQLAGVTASGLLRPSEVEPGASDFVVTVQAVEMSAGISADNRGSGTTGVWTVSADSLLRSPLGDGGQLALNASAAPDVQQRRSVQAKYTEPLGDDGATLSLSGLITHGQPGGSTAQLQLISDSRSVATRVSYPLVLERQEKLLLEVGANLQSSDVHALGAPFSHDDWRDVDLAVIFQESQFLSGVSTVTIDDTKGLPILGASSADSPTLSRPGGRPDFNKVTAAATHIQPLIGPVSLSLAANGQYAFNRLLTGEEVNFGGAGPGRGYDPGALTGDSGVGGSAELRYDLDGSDLSLDQLQFYGFFDGAKVWLKQQTLPSSKLASTGGGIRTIIDGTFSLNGEIAHTLLPLVTDDNGKRDNRLLFSGSARF